MDEIRKDNPLEIYFGEEKSIKGTVLDYEKDRVLVKIMPENLNIAKELNELDDIEVKVKTNFGYKVMISSVISSLNNFDCIIIENTDAIAVEQKREFARIASDINFTIQKNGLDYSAKCENISASGIAFLCNDKDFDLQKDDIIKIIYPKDVFSRDISVNARTVSANKPHFRAKYLDLNQYDESCIVKYVFKLMAKK